MSTNDSALPSPSNGLPAGWARVFGYDMFISFALGSPPRGSRAYASDLARRLRERGFTVFFSEDEAPAGEKLDPTLLRALRKSRILVVVANRGTLADPRYVRTEVKAYRAMRPKSPVVPISVDCALDDSALAASTQTWMPFSDRVWVNETADACASGRVSDETLRRLVTAPHAIRSLARLRIAVCTVVAVLVALAVFATLQRYAANEERDRAQDALLASSARQALLLSRDGRANEGWNVLVDALAEARPQVDGTLPKDFLEAALITLIEDRHGPELNYDLNAPPPLHFEVGGWVPPPSTFDAGGTQVAVATGEQLAVWDTANGRRKMQVSLPFAVERLTFAADGTWIVAEGAEAIPADIPVEHERLPERHAVAVDVSNGHATQLPLKLCKQSLPCVASVKHPKRLSPISEFSASDMAEGVGYFALAAGDMRLNGLSGDQFAVIEQERWRGPSTWSLVDWRSGASLLLDKSLQMSKFDAANYIVASDAPILVASAWQGSNIWVSKIIASRGGLSLTPWRVLQTRFSTGKMDMQLTSDGTTLRYQNYLRTSGAGNGLGRTVVLDIASGREQWARGEGFVAWGEQLVALQEFWAETQVLSAPTGATWFTTPGRPLAFDPTGRMLLIQDRTVRGATSSPWPRLRLLETLPVRQFARSPTGPSYVRSQCVPHDQLKFVTLNNRHDRLWNRDDWHRLNGIGERKAAHGFKASVSTRSSRVTTVQEIRLKDLGKHWELRDYGDGSAPADGISLDLDQVLQKFPQLAAELKPGQDRRFKLATSADKRWSAVVTGVDREFVEDDDSNRDVEKVQCWARWSLHRGQETTPIKTGCTLGREPGAGFLPVVSFLPSDGKWPPIAAVPTDTCRYELWDLERDELLGAAIPAFGNEVRLQRLPPDLLTVSSTDWHGGSTLAYQIIELGTATPGPFFVMEPRSLGPGSEDEEDEGEYDWTSNTEIEGVPVLVENEADGYGLETAFSPDGRTLFFGADDPTTMLNVPPWGERLRERLRQAVSAKRTGK